MLNKTRFAVLAILAGAVVPAWALTVRVNNQVVPDVEVAEVQLGADSINLIIPGGVTLVSSDAPPGDTGGGDTGGGDTGGGDTGGSDSGDDGVDDSDDSDVGVVITDPGCNDTTVLCRDSMGVITQTVASERITFVRDAIIASNFSVGTGTSAPAVFFDFAPQGAVVGEQRVWISTEPGGPPLQANGRCEAQDASRAYTVTAYLAGRSSRDNPDRFCVINAGETYYLNQELLRTVSSQIVIRSIGGAF